MHRPLRVPFYLRLWNLIKGVLLYNTVDWEKASDGLNMPTLTREEREKKRPVANMEIIRPREKPRARIDDAIRGAQVSKPEPYTQISDPLPPPPLSSPVAYEQTREAVEAKPDHRPEGTYVKRRKYKRRRASRSSGGGKSFFQRIFGREL